MTGWLRLDGSPSNGRHNNYSAMLLELIGKMAGTTEKEHNACKMLVADYMAFKI